MILIDDYFKLLKQKRIIKNVLSNAKLKKAELKEFYLESSGNSSVVVDDCVLADPDGNVINYIYEYREKPYIKNYSIHDCILNCERELLEIQKEIVKVRKQIKQEKDITYIFFSEVVFGKRTPTFVIHKLTDKVASQSTLWRVHKKLKKHFGNYDKI